MLDRLLADGILYLFVSNSDNLGATLDLDLLAYFAETDKAFMMEVNTIISKLVERQRECSFFVYLYFIKIFFIKRLYW